MKGTREQSPQDFYKFVYFKTMKLLLSSVLLFVFFISYRMDIVSFPTKHDKLKYYV